MDQPLVSIIVVSHNQGPYIREAIQSALSQDYANVEVIVVDDCSSDHTVPEIEKISSGSVPFTKMLFPQAAGYCHAFNKGLAVAKGRFIIDLAGDDVLMPDRAELGVCSMLASGAGVDFCDAYYIDEHSQNLGTHYRRDANDRLMEQVPDGSIFRELLERYFICTPTMMIDREVIEALGGYDDSLYYEDFDFWVRSSRHFRYHFTDRVMVKKSRRGKGILRGNRSGLRHDTRGAGPHLRSVLAG
jgi:glycosyltransferase involved in cell wall biosynthesis